MKLEKSKIEQLPIQLGGVREDDILNVYITKWETSLFSKKHTLQKAIQAASKAITAAKEAVFQDVKAQAKVFCRKLLTDNIEICLSHKDEVDEDEDVKFEPKISLSEKTAKYALVVRSLSAGDRKVITITSNSQKSAKVKPSLWEDWDRFKDGMDEARSDLAVVVQELSQIGRKERQVRAIVSEKRLSDAGIQIDGHNEIVKLLGIRD